jgi:hypothetical protein
MLSSYFNLHYLANLLHLANVVPCGRVILNGYMSVA